MGDNENGRFSPELEAQESLVLWMDYHCKVGILQIYFAHEIVRA
jgi:hypothetical protein